MSLCGRRMVLGRGVVRFRVSAGGTYWWHFNRFVLQGPKGLSFTDKVLSMLP